MTKDLIKKVIIYSVIAFGITWTIAFGIYWLFRKEMIIETQLNFLHSFAAIGPAVAAFVTTRLFYGKQGIKKLVSKLKFQIPNRQTIRLTLSPLLFFIIGLLVFRLIKSENYNFELFAKLNWSEIYPFTIWLLPLLTYAIFEEIGWRGFLLPHLQVQFSAWTSTIILTIIWAVWHIPFFFYRFDFSVGIAIGFFFGIFVGSIILTSIYNSSKGNIIPVMIFHFLNNFSSMFDKEIIVAVLSTGFVFVAIYIYKTLGKDNFSKIERTKNYFINDDL